MERLTPFVGSTLATTVVCTRLPASRLRSTSSVRPRGVNFGDDDLTGVLSGQAGPSVTTARTVCEPISED